MTQSTTHTGFGTLGFTWRPTLIPDSQAFPCFRAAISSGSTIFSTSSVYGPASNPLAGLQLLARYFAAYPEDIPKVTLFIRGCFDAKTFSPRCDRKGVRASFAEAEDVFRPVGKKIDVFGPARMDQSVAVEETIGAVKELVEEGRVGGVGLSEVRAETIRRARKVCEVRYVEVEFSMWTQEMLGNGVADAARECGVAVLAYSPLGYGFLTGELRRLEDIPEGDGRLRMGRFQEDVGVAPTYSAILYLHGSRRFFRISRWPTRSRGLRLPWA